MWNELKSNDINVMIDELVRYKQEHYPDDRRRILTCGIPEGEIHVEWLPAATHGIDSRFDMQLYGLVRSGEHEQAVRFLQETQGISRNQAMKRVARISAQLGIESADEARARGQAYERTTPSLGGMPMARPKKPGPKVHKPGEQGDVRLYTLEVFLLSGPIAEKFAKKNPEISRTIQIRGDQTLEDLHHVVFDAFDRWDEHMYEFQFGKGPMDPKGSRYVLPSAFEMDQGEANPPAGRVDQTRIDSLGLNVGQSFGYWFDFGDDWWHQIDVEAIEDKAPAGKFPKVTKRVGKSPPQYLEEDE